MLYVFFPQPICSTLSARNTQTHALFQGFPVTELISCLSCMSFEAGITPRVTCGIATTLCKIKPAIMNLE